MVHLVSLWSVLVADWPPVVGQCGGGPNPLGAPKYLVHVGCPPVAPQVGGVVGKFQHLLAAVALQ